MRCHCGSIAPHTRHLYIGGRAIALTLTEVRATAYLPDGTLMQLTEPHAMRDLRKLVKKHLEAQA